MDGTGRVHDDYTVAWICPLEVEQIAATAMLDEQHSRLSQPANDHNAYALGSIYGHNVVIAGLPLAGNTSAATVVAQMRNTFQQLRFGLLVGIGGGVPTRTDNGYIRLGHVVVSKPTGQHSGAVQYDHGKAEAGAFRRTGFLAPPPTVLLNAAQRLSVTCALASTDPVVSHLRRIDTSKRQLRRYKHPGANKDHLYQPDYVHLDREASCQKCGCDISKIVVRKVDDSDGESDAEEDTQDADEYVVVHRGTIAAGEKVMRNGIERDQLAKENGLLCFEMEAAGALNDFPCLVIRGISDYSDSHKNDKWHGYAAAVAAAYARELFVHMPVDEVKQCKIAESDVKQIVEDTRFVADSTRNAEIKSWLAPVDVSTNYNEARTQHHLGTGRWFLESEEYAQWKTHDKGVLWLHGIPGCGKTIMSSSVIEDLRTAGESSKRVVLYFFFDANDSAKQSVDKMVRSLVFQLYRHAESTRKHVEQLYLSCESGREQPSTRTLLDTWEMMAENIGDPYVVLDALDECKTRSDLLLQLPRLQFGRVCLLVTSRTEEDIASSLREWIPPSNAVSVRQGPVDVDIREVVRNRIATDPKLRRFQSRPDVCTEIETRLMEKADGMFRWAVCQLDALQACLDLPSLREALQSLPAGLNETYARILRGIPEMHKARAIRILQFLTFAENPLRLEEIVDAIAVNLEHTPAFEPENRLLDPKEIAGYCSSLAKFTTRRSYKYKEDVDKDTQIREHIYNLEHPGEDADEDAVFDCEEVVELQLAHASVNDYLVSNQVPDDFKDALSLETAHRAIADISVAYLMTATHTFEGPDNSSSLPFLQYCADSWTQHAAIAETVIKRCSPWTIRLFTASKEFEYWAGLHRGHMYFAEDSDTLLPLSFAAYYGLQESVKMLLETGINVDAVDYGGDVNALVIASRQGHATIVRLLLAKGARLFAGLALQSACDYGNEEVVQLLLETGAVASDALYVASLRGHEAVVRLLLEQGADIEKRSDALLQASSQGHEETVRLLLVNADVDAYAGFVDALETACIGGHEAVVRLLLEKGACINDSEALRVAGDGGHEAVVRLLLQEGADVHATDVLHDACSGGNEAIVQLLLKEGADVNAESEYSGYPLIVASYGGQEAIARLLLVEGAHVNAYSRNYRDVSDALEAASYNGHEAIVRLLLREGAKADEHRRYLGALQAACSRNFESVVQLLLQNGADVNAQVGYYGNALWAAAYGGYRALVELLLKEGANVNTHGKGDMGALCAAAMEGHEAAVRLLLAKGADVNVQGGPWRNALRAAASGGHIAVMQLLLEAGADDVEDVDEYGNHESALSVAIENGHKAVVQVLQAARANGKGSVPGRNLYREPPKLTGVWGGFWDHALESV
ncbi:hypothetical protein LTR01_004678 [Friedmanniomyces endolithicus]|nr:hypothetical protein LTR01_004678 [Friedmanniomyces endolithicus]KAK0829813.1 hypothetical protein LTR73_003949 [Friedmanniomyces endolithicus]